MRTTLNFNDRILREAKKRAADEGETLTRLIEKALTAYLQPRKKSTGAFKLKLPVVRGRPVAGFSLDDRDSLYERMEGRS